MSIGRSRGRLAALICGTALVLAPLTAAAQSEPPKPKQIVVNASGGSMGSAMR